MQEAQGPIAFSDQSALHVILANTPRPSKVYDIPCLSCFCCSSSKKKIIRFRVTWWPLMTSSCQFTLILCDRVVTNLKPPFEKKIWSISSNMLHDLCQLSEILALLHPQNSKQEQRNLQGSENWWDPPQFRDSRFDRGETGRGRKKLPNPPQAGVTPDVRGSPIAAGRRVLKGADHLRASTTCVLNWDFVVLWTEKFYRLGWKKQYWDSLMCPQTDGNGWK